MFIKDAMKENPKHDSLPWRQCATFAAILAVIQACLTIEGRGIEGFILWVIIIFVAYLILFTFLVWLWRRLRDRA
jgi:hypothetical protein